VENVTLTSRIVTIKRQIVQEGGRREEEEGLIRGERKKLTARTSFFFIGEFCG